MFISRYATSQTTRTHSCMKPSPSVSSMIAFLRGYRLRKLGRGRTFYTTGTPASTKFAKHNHMLVNKSLPGNLVTTS